MHPTDAIRYYVQGAFRGVKETPEVLEQQEEIIADLTAKVEDLVSEGTPEAEALGIALASVGDLSALVLAFEAEDPAAVPAVPVFSARLDFHARALTVALGGVLMTLSVVVGALLGVIYPGAGLALVVVLAVAAWWLSDSWRTLREEPHAVAEWTARSRGWLRTTIGSWFAVCFIALVANMMTGEFWLWPIWVAATAWACRPLIVRTLVRAGLFTVSRIESVREASSARPDGIGAQATA